MSKRKEPVKPKQNRGGNKPGGNARKRAIPPPVKPNPPKTREIVAITTVINGLQAFVSALSTTQGGRRFIPHWTTNKENALDFLTVTRARDTIALMHYAAGDGPIYELVNIEDDAE